MKVHVLSFASAREAIGSDTVDCELPAGSDLDALRQELTAGNSELGALWPRLAIAVDGRLVQGNVELVDGQEVALLPPVSGGQEDRAALIDGPIAIAQVMASVSSARRGAVVVFLGNVRNSHQERLVERLTYDAYRPMAETAMAKIVAELSDDATDLAVAIHHRLGVVEAGETSVAIVAASPHRDLAYAANRTALERLKREVPIWKREHYASGEAAWREEEPLSRHASGSRS